MIQIKIVERRRNSSANRFGWAVALSDSPTVIAPLFAILGRV